MAPIVIEMNFLVYHELSSHEPAADVDKLAADIAHYDTDAEDVEDSNLACRLLPHVLYPHLSLQSLNV